MTPEMKEDVAIVTSASAGVATEATLDAVLDVLLLGSASCGSLPGFVNKVLSEHSHSHSFRSCL